MKEFVFGPVQTTIPSPTNIPRALPQFATLPLIPNALLFTLPVGLLGSGEVVVAVGAIAPVPTFTSMTVTVEFTSQFCLLNGGGPQYVSFALEESEDKTYVIAQKKV
jgi:hypothetical protein